MSDALAEFQRLLDKRELAAVRLVGTVDSVISFFEAQDFEAALLQLKRARDEYNAVDRQISEFHKSHTGEIPHGHRNAAA